MRTHAVRVIGRFLFHGAVFALSYALAWQLRFEFAIAPEFHGLMWGSFPIVVGVQLLMGILFSIYGGWWRYVGIGDVVRLVGSLTASLAILMTAWYATELAGIGVAYTKPPRGVLLIDWAFALLILFGVRMAARLGRHTFRSSPSMHHNVLIIGAGDAGETLAREIEHRPQLGIKVVGFVDDDRRKFGASIRGIEIFGPIADIARISDSTAATEAFIAIPSATGDRIREIIHLLSSADLRFKTMPGIDQMVSGRVHVSQLRPVNIDDMLRRERIELPGDPVRQLLTGKRVLVTGAGGTIGSELVVQIARLEPSRLALVERSEFALYEIRRRIEREVPWASAEISSHLLDIADLDLANEMLERERPDLVLHAAAHKHVPLGEENPVEYLRNNTLATRSFAEIAARAGVERFVLISTDKAINPTGVMGASKRAAEVLLRDIAHQTGMQCAIVRFGNVIGSSGSVIPLFLEQIAAGGPVTVTHPDVTRYFIRTSEAISLVLQAATLRSAAEIFTLDMGEPVRILDLAHDLIQVSQTHQEIPITFIGLRPGEKLFEEIRLDSESTRPTIHPQIVVTETTQPDPAFVASWVRQAEAARDGAAAVALLVQLIPEYRPAQGAHVVPLRRPDSAKPAQSQSR
jgi:FlaA1/EpsC-like NDP-sugar epimerase